MNAQLAPVIVFAYNRPDHLRKVLESIERNPEAATSVLYVYCDGPKKTATAQTKQRIAAVRKVAAERKWCGEVHVVASEFNKGLAGSVIGGVTEVVNRHGSVIVLEDDAVCAPHFLSYMNSALSRYENDTRVISIAGFVYPVKIILPDTFFLRGADCIAWATWKRGWDQFENDGAVLLSQLEKEGLQNEFDFGGTYPYTQMLKDQIGGRNDSWAIRWYASAFLKGKFTLYPGRPVIANIGFDGTGINSGVSEHWEVKLSPTPLKVDAIPVEDNLKARKAFAQFFTEMRKASLTSRIKQAVWARLPGFVRRAWSGSSGNDEAGWHGSYTSWEEALNNSEGYDSGSILEKVKVSLRKVKAGEAAYERDSVTFEKLEAQPEITRSLKKIAEEHGNKLRVTDFGGSLGSSYFQYRQLLNGVQLQRWTVVEQEHFVIAGKSEFADEVLKFTVHSEKSDVLLLFSVLPYLEKPFEVIAQLCKLGYDYIIIDRTPVIPGSLDKLTVQVVPESIYKGSYPAWFFGEQKLLNSFSGYEVMEKFESKFASSYKMDDGVVAHWNGYILKKK